MREWLAARAETDPDTLALVDADTGDRLTYEELDGLVDSYAASLASTGISSGARVGALLTRGPAYIALVWAVFRIGATLVPLDVKEAPETIEATIGRVGLDHLVVEKSTVETGRAAAQATLDISTVDTLSDGLPQQGAAQTQPEATSNIGLDDTQVVLFTSGTSGEPKGVRLTRRNLGASAAGSAFRLGVEPGDRWLLTLPMYHMGGLSIPIRAAIYGTTVVVEREFDPSTTADRMAAHDVTGISMVPTMLRRLLDAGWEPAGLRFALVGGAPTPTPLAERAISRGVPLYTTYGMTETASQVATATPEEVEQYPGTVGKPLRVATVDILDRAGEPIESSDDAVAEPGARGEITVSGPIVSPGYLDDETKRPTDAFRTGDLGYLDDGRLYVEGRRDDVIITGGENVHPRAVEAQILDHPAVADVIVVGIPDEEWGEQVGALVVVSDGGRPADIEAVLDERLASYKVPKSIGFVDRLPRTQSGTVDREAARDLLRRSAEAGADAE